MHLNHPETIPHPSPWKIRILQNQSMAPKSWGLYIHTSPLFWISFLFRSPEATE